jgi:alpha-N-acetylglucosaminidase
LIDVLAISIQIDHDSARALRQRSPPAGGFPAVAKPITLKKKAKWSYYQNVCTQSYSMWWYAWEDWERNLDWAALWGVNLVLAYTGQEKIFRDVFNKIGVNDSVLNNTFDGPAFLTWSRGQGTFGVGGPLPNYWIESQHALQVKIMDRLRELGMHGILPGFQGNVPKEMPELFPRANTSNGWLDALDPLFDTIGHGVGTAMQKEFGPATFVEADGWFSLETGPWLVSEAGPAYHEDTLQALGSGASTEDVLAATFGLDLRDAADSGGCLGNFVIPTEEEAFTRANTVFRSLVAARPDSTWVYQGYPWFRVHSQGGSCNQTALRYFIKGFTDAIPKDRLLILDLIADMPGNALWSYAPDPVLGPFAQNASLIWCALANWGGAVHMGGDLTYVLNDTRRAFATPADSGGAAATVGVGLAPEGIDNSAPYFSLVLDAPWTEQPTAQSWFQEWGTGRCGKAGVEAAEKAYDLLFQSVYRPGKPYLFCCSKPKFCPTVHPGDVPDPPGYNVSLVREALELMVEASTECTSKAFLYDLVDIAREWLSMGPCIDAWHNISCHSSSCAAAPAELTSEVRAFMDVNKDVDAMMATDESFLLGAWLKNSRAVSDWDGSDGTLAGFYEWNSRVQITTWAGGYSRREWSGMVDSYYGGRTQIWLNNTLRQMAAEGSAQENTDVVEAGTYRAVTGYDCNFQDLGKHAGQTEAQLETLCNAQARCIGFNFPHGILKSGCRGWEASAGDTFYFKPGHATPNLPPPPTSSCVNNVHGLPYAVCEISHGKQTGTYNGTNCDGNCKPLPKLPPLTQQLAEFASRWQNETWTEAVLPSKAAGDPVAMAKKLLAKYP